MKKRGLIISVSIVLIVIIVIICMHFFPSSPDGYVDLVEVVEISNYTEEEFRDRMLGQYRVDIVEGWGEPNSIGEDMDIYEFENIPFRIILEYDSNGQVINLERSETDWDSYNLKETRIDFVLSNKSKGKRFNLALTF